MDVLVTDGFDKKSLSVVHAIRPVADEIGTTVQFPFSLSALSRHTARDHRVRAASPSEYVSTLTEIIERYDYDYLLPVSGRTTEIVSEHRDEIPVPLDPILPPQSSFRRVIDKHDLQSMAEDVGVPTPTSVRITSLDDVPEAIETVGPTGVFKTGRETEPRFLRYVESAPELQTTYLRYRESHQSDPIYQTYLGGQGRGFFGLYLDGECRGHYAHRRIREFPPSGGKSVCAESVSDPELSQYAQQLMSALEWNGIVMLEFKDDADGNAHLLECNPKFWGSMELGVTSGMNFPRALLEYLDRGAIPEFEFTPQRFHWPLSGDLLYALERPESASDVVADLLSGSSQSNVRLSDPLPHVSEVAGSIASGFYTADGPIT